MPHEDSHADRPRAPLRTCVVCRKKLPKDQLLRHVLVHGEYTPDPRQRMHGRGCYTCLHDEQCRERFRQRRSRRKPRG